MGHCLFMRKGETHTAPVSGILASDIAVGSVVKLMENGVATEYLVVNQGKPSGSSLYDDSCDGTWLLRKDIKEERQWHSSDVNDYKNSITHSYLNSDFISLFDTDIQSAIKQVKIPYVNGSGSGGSVASGSNGLSCKVFLLSGYEIGWNNYTNTNIPIDGAKLEYFESGTTTSANNKRIAYLNSNATMWWTRSPRMTKYNSVFLVDYEGNYSNGIVNYSYGIRPALILPSTALFDTNTLILKGVA